jgi:protein phosphatase
MDNGSEKLQTISTVGDIPLNRFGHTTVYLSKIKICLFGGSVGDSRKLNYTNETFTYNILTKIWKKINIKNKDSIPKERAAHAAASNEKGQMAIYGGSTTTGGLAEDILYLFSLNIKDENEGEWKKIKTKGDTPGERYGHSLTYLNPYFVLFGGNFNPHLSNDVWIININDNTDYYQWIKINYINDKDNMPIERLYHSSEMCNYGKYKNKLIIFGGRNSKNIPLNDLWCLDIKDNKGEWIKLFPNNNNNENNKNKNILTPRLNHTMLFYDNLLIILGGKSSSSSPVPIEVFDIESNECFKFIKLTMNRHTSFIFENDIYFYGGFNLKSHMPLGDIYKISLNKIFVNSPLLKIISEKNIEKNKDENNNKEKNHYRLSNEVVIGSDGILTNINNKTKETTQDELSLFRKLSISKLTDENKRIGDIDKKNTLISRNNIYNKILIEKFIDTLLRPLDWFDQKKMAEIHNKFPFTKDNIESLVEEVIPILSKENSLIKIRSPCKIFGNIYGVYNDLMRFFESYGNPSDNIQNGDINVMQYIFLGDFCDRGLYSLETVLLLFALKIKYPNFIYLIRGHHEDKNINEFYGLGKECKERLNDDINKENSIFNLINKVFDYLPFGVIVDGTTLLIHGGIGCSIEKLDDINNINRPISVVHDVKNIEELHVIDLLYSEYDDNENNYNVNNERDKMKKGFIVKYGKKRLDSFLNNNNINLLITAHQFVKDGFCTFNNDKLLVLFSATNYMDKYNNIGAMITIAKKTANKRLNIIPKLINLNTDKKELYRKDKSPSPVKTKK